MSTTYLLPYHANKVQLNKELKPIDHKQRKELVEWIMKQQKINTDFPNKILFSDEAYFHRDGLVNRRNCHIWSLVNPQVIVEKQVHPQHVTVW